MKKQWSSWDGNLKSVAALYNQMTPRARQRLHAYLEDVTNPSSLVKTKLTNRKEQDDGIYTVGITRDAELHGRTARSPRAHSR
jgi:hypothetical protein